MVVLVMAFIVLSVSLVLICQYNRSGLFCNQRKNILIFFEIPGNIVAVLGNKNIKMKHFDFLRKPGKLRILKGFPRKTSDDTRLTENSIPGIRSIPCFHTGSTELEYQVVHNIKQAGKLQKENRT